ncbi:MAG: peptidoglycan DD-metalloendopeptidase family protein [Stenotrophobium sp.]
MLSVVSLTALMTRESTASRDPVLPAGSEAASIGNPDAQNGANFDNAIQDAVSDNLPVPAASDWVTVTVEPGETISNLIEGLGIPGSDWKSLAALGQPVAALNNLRSGKQVNILKNADGHLEELTYDVDETHTLQVRRNGDTFEVADLETQLDHHPIRATGTIDSSLYASGQKAGLSNRLIKQMADLFGYDVDFALDLREGDHFVVIYDATYKNGKKIRNGDILAAEFTNRGHIYRVMRYVGKNGVPTYYTPQGQSLRKAFIRTPVAFARISSPFSLHRRHPILNTIRAHKGVDYAAPIGTPVKATGDGHVEFIGVERGFGNVIILKHGRKYETVYGHLSRFRSRLRRGNAVRQGEVIGYVGMTGLATGPHLHYEFRVNGVQKNPVTVVLPRANPLSHAQLVAWHARNASLIAMLDNSASSKIAQASQTTVAAEH